MPALDDQDRLVVSREHQTDSNQVLDDMLLGSLRTAQGRGREKTMGSPPVYNQIEVLETLQALMRRVAELERWRNSLPQMVNVTTSYPTPTTTFSIPGPKTPSEPC